MRGGLRLSNDWMKIGVPEQHTRMWIGTFVKKHEP